LLASRVGTEPPERTSEIVDAASGAVLFNRVAKRT
jgi:hypothetical protein